MSRFYVGQRVRLVYVSKPENKHLVGMECSIVSVSTFIDGTPGLGLSITPLAKSGWLAEPEWVEPILYDGNQLVSWEECLWQPEGQAA